MLLSLVVHGLLALILVFIPGPARRVAFDACFVETGPGVSLSLAEPSDRPAPTATTGSAGEEQDDKDYKVVDAGPPSPPAGTIAAQAPVIIGRPKGAGSTGTGDTGAGGTGTPTGGRPSLLEAPPQARRVVYVLDRSLSMGPSRALSRARQELLSALARLPAGASFQVVLYNLRAEPLRIDARSGYLPADESTRAAVAAALERTAATGSTNHVNALRQGLFLHPDVLFLVTDADELSERDVQEVVRINAARTAIHVIELSRRRPDAGGPLCRLAALTGGSFRRVAPD
jgi:hypothetical protein